MSNGNKHSKLPASEAVKRQSLDEWKEILARYPLTSYRALAFNILTALSANALTAWLVITGRMTPFELVLLVALEAALLIGMALLQQRFVPPEAREKHVMGVSVWAPRPSGCSGWARCTELCCSRWCRRGRRSHARCATR
jgi:hypothetical protein